MPNGMYGGVALIKDSNRSKGSIADPIFNYPPYVNNPLYLLYLRFIIFAAIVNGGKSSVKNNSARVYSLRQYQ